MDLRVGSDEATLNLIGENGKRGRPFVAHYQFAPTVENLILLTVTTNFYGKPLKIKISFVWRKKRLHIKYHYDLYGYIDSVFHLRFNLYCKEMVSALSMKELGVAKYALLT